MELDSFKVGDAVEVTYLSPSSKGSVCNVALTSGCEENIPIRVAIKYHWPVNSVLATHTPDGWGTGTWVSITLWE